MTDLQTQASACRIERGLLQKNLTMHRTNSNKVSKLVTDGNKTEGVSAAD